MSTYLAFSQIFSFTSIYKEFFYLIYFSINLFNVFYLYL